MVFYKGRVFGGHCVCLCRRVKLQVKKKLNKVTKVRVMRRTRSSLWVGIGWMINASDSDWPRSPATVRP